MGSFYTPGKNSIFWLMIKSLTDNFIFNKQPNILPFTPLKKQLYIDFVNQPALTVVNVFINGKLDQQTLVVDGTGLVQFETFLPYTRGTEITVELRRNSDGLLLRSNPFSTWNLYMFYEVYGKDIQPKEQELTAVQNDGVLSEARDAALFPNFGVFFDLAKRFDQTFEQYRDVLESFYIAFLNQATDKGVIEAIHDLTGFNPIIQSFKDLHGWLIYEDYKYTPSFPTTTDTDPTRPHMFLEDTTVMLDFGSGPVSTFLPPVKPFSTLEKGNAFYIIMTKADITTPVVDEPIVKSGFDSLGSFQPIDHLSSTHLTVSPVTIISTDGVYTESVFDPPPSGQFFVDRLLGLIKWNFTAAPPVGQPVTGNIYNVTYNFQLIDAIEKVLRQLKPAFRKPILKVV